VWFVIGIYLVLVFALPIGVGAVMSYRGLPVGRACPHCGNETLRLLALMLSRCSLVVPGVLQRRWCMCCGWEGTVRLPRPPRRHAAGRPQGPPHRTADGRHADAGVETSDATATLLPPGAEHAYGVGDAGNGQQQARPMTQTLDVRSLTLDGTPWRVMLQCWRTTGCYYGRFVFVAPSGRLWLDCIEAFSGASENEVLGQALALPDGLLATRLRRLVTDY
jgi:hypothetical protein